jgi:predicted GIY-YIG superfamily endonuclease
MGVKLYRHFNSDGVLLYVGISINAVLRLSQHRQMSHWYDEIANITLESFETRAEALKAETHAIQNEKPKYNIQKTAIRPAKCVEDAIDESKRNLNERIVQFGIMYTPTTAASALEISSRAMKFLVDNKKIGTITLPAPPGLTHHGNPYKEKTMITGWQLIEYVEHLMEKKRDLARL